ncbi:hypothetical protein V8D89_008511 [Ganoderma adspersum]
MLPTELWIEILKKVPRGTLAQLMVVNRSLCEVAEPILYRSITLMWNATQGQKFRDSITSCPRRALLVIDFTFIRLKGMDDSLVELPHLLMALQNLRSVRLVISTAAAGDCDGVFDVRLPHLHSFATTVDIGADAQAPFFAFLTAHPELDALDFRFSNPPDLPAAELQAHLALRPFSSLRALACSSHFLNSRAPVLASLTHLHRMVYIASEVAHIAALLGPQLLSLRLEGSLDLGVAGAAKTELRWSLAEVAARFPRLRYLQVDMPYREQPYLDTGVVDWLSPRPAAAATHGPPDAAATPAQKLTIAWTYGERFWSGFGGWGAAYDAFLDGAALQCLNGWRGYVERVVYERSRKPYPMVSVALKPGIHGGGEEVVRVQDADIGWGDYWKRA